MAYSQWSATAVSCDDSQATSSGGVRDGAPAAVAAVTLGVKAEVTPASNASLEADETLLARIQAFSEQREEERKRMFRRVAWLFYWLLISGGVGILAKEVVSAVFSLRQVGQAMNVAAFTFLVWGVVIGSACPLDMLDMDETYRKNAMKFGLIWFSAVFNAVWQVPDFPHVDALEVLIAVGGVVSGCSRCLPSWWPGPSSWGCLYLIVDQASWGLKQLMPHMEPNDEKVPAMAARGYGGVAVLLSALALSWWLWRRWEFRQKRNQCGPWMQFYEVLYSWCFAMAAVRGIQGASMLLAPQPGFEDLLGAWLLIVRSVLLLFTCGTICILGRHRLFNLLGQSFDSDGARLQRDGAFVAELLEAVPLDEGQSWWVHREQADSRFPPYDPHRNWQQGFVVEVTAESGEFMVQLPAPEDARGPLLALSSSSLGPKMPLKLPSGGVGKSKEDLLVQAQKELRCVEFEKLSLDVMMRNVDGPEQKAAWHELSRPVRQGEQIDFFMSQSWYDDPVRKWEKICEVAGRFHQRHGRYPTFWLDKLCIDQAAITDGLRCLPVNVMACHKLLALCGDTYTSRLWCIWELFTLFAFVSEAAALERVEFAFLGSHEEGLAMLNAMASFHVSEAHCYDPNTEARLRRVIDAVGTGRFNKRISNLALATRAKLEQEESRKGTGLASKSLSVTGVWSWANGKTPSQKPEPVEDEEEGMPAV